MEVKLIIRTTRDEDDVNVIGKQYSFVGKDKITIGRGKPNDIPLLDSDRTVSRTHAQLVEGPDGYVLKDLGSKNFSYLNEEKVSLKSARLLSSGDIIRIGEFEIEYLLPEKIENDDLTIIDPIGAIDFSVNNPFSNAVQDMLQSWEKLTALYDTSDVGTRSDYMVHALKHEGASLEGHEVMRMFFNQINMGAVAEETYVPSAVKEETLDGAAPEVPTPSSASSSVYVPTGTSSLVLDEVLKLLKELIRIPYEFRGEFIGHTMWQDEESTFLYEGDHEVTKKYLLDDVNETEVRRKLARLKKASEKVKFHQVGMMEGYKAVVKEGLG